MARIAVGCIACDRRPVEARKYGNLCRQTLAALGAAAGQNAQSALGLHALAETVTALPHELTWLIGSFHGFGSRFDIRVTSTLE